MPQKLPPLYVLPGANPGLLIKGNIDINHRPNVKNPAGGYSSVYSSSRELVLDDGTVTEVLFPTVIPGKILSPQAAYIYYVVRRHQWLGIFDTPLHANMYARRLHRQQAALYNKNKRAG